MRRRCLRCSALIDGGSYCTRCAPRSGSTLAWRKVRASILAANPVCAECLRPAAHVDHIEPIAHGGTDDPAHLRSRCASCKVAKADR